MKTDQVNINKPANFGIKDKSQITPKDQERPHIKEASETKAYQEPTDRVELKKSAINTLEPVKKLMGDSIQWREMKFYQRSEGGQTYIDIVDRSTGNLVRTIPDTKLAEVTDKLKHLSGSKFSING